MNIDMLSSISNEKFSEARRRAFLGTALRFLRGESNELLPFDEIRSQLRLKHSRDLGIQEIALDKIVGSMGRYEDFTREFFPRRDNESVELRWRRIYDLTNSLEGFPPIEVFKVGEVYFVRDGNHRVSVARANEAKTIEAHVIEYLSPIELTPDDTMDDVLIKIGEASFLEATNLDKLRPEQNIKLTNPGRYRLLLEHIAVHKYLKEVECNCEIPYEEAVVSWYDNVYMPLVQEIRERGILERFPGRTEADLYAWLVLHRAALEEAYGFGQVSMEEIMEALEEEGTTSPLRKMERAIKRKLDPDSLPPPVE